MLSVIGGAAVLNSFIEPALASAYDVETAIWFAFAMQLLSFFIMLFAVFLNRYAMAKDGADVADPNKAFKMR